MRIIILILIFASSLFAEQIEVVKDCALRSDPDLSSKVIGWADEGYYKKLAEYAHYWLVMVVDSRTDLTNKGWVWQKRIERDEGYYIGLCGVTLRNGPSKTNAALGFIFPDSRILRVYDKWKTWYMIRVGEEEGWIRSMYVKGKYCRVRIKSFEETLWENFGAKKVKNE